MTDRQGQHGEEQLVRAHCTLLSVGMRQAQTLVLFWGAFAVVCVPKLGGTSLHGACLGSHTVVTAVAA